MHTIKGFSMKGGVIPQELKDIIAAEGVTVPFNPSEITTSEPVAEWVKLKHDDVVYEQDTDLTFKPV